MLVQIKFNKSNAKYVKEDALIELREAIHVLQNDHSIL